MSDRHYLDHASSSALRPEGGLAISKWIAEQPTGDPGRVHTEGQIARDAIEQARAQVAALLGTASNRVVFTSSATEAANAAIFAASRSHPGTPTVCAGVEHSCVREAAERSGQVLLLEVDSSGRIDLDHLDSLLAAKGQQRPALVNCQWFNHEVGTLQPVAEVVARCRSAGVGVHVDAAAAAGHVPLDLDELGADYVSVSGHKFGAPPGVGVLVVRRGLRPEPLIVGGSQERARRGGFENIIGIIGLGAVAAALAEPGRLSREEAAARGFTDALARAATSVGDVALLGDPTRRAPHIVTATVGHVLGEAVLLGLDRSGIAAHSGSACSSESIEPSPVLAAMGADPDSSLRLSVGWSTTEADVEAFASAFPRVVERLRALKSSDT
ncbi:MAG: aminotransferase class V-fold PLP-dependent enzyme [Acidimicrobiales bacterium]